MTSQPLFLAILLLSALTAHSQFSKCPADNPLQLASDWITVSNQGQVALTKGADVQCYNYTLATAFSCTPGVAIGTRFMMQPSTDWKASTEPISSSLSRLSIQIAIQSFPSSSARSGDTLSGAGSPLPSLPKAHLKSRLDTTKLTLLLSPPATQANQ